MAVNITTLKELQKFTVGALERINHAGNKADKMLLALLGVVVWLNEDESLTAFIYPDEPEKNCLWFTYKKKRCCISFNRNMESLEMKSEGVNQFPHAFLDNDSDFQEILDALEKI